MYDCSRVLRPPTLNFGNFGFLQGVPEIITGYVLVYISMQTSHILLLNQSIQLMEAFQPKNRQSIVYGATITFEGVSKKNQPKSTKMKCI